MNSAATHPLSQRRLILASTSPYRKVLLERLHIPFEVHSPGVDEAPLPHEEPESLAKRLAMAKAQAVACVHPAALVIGSDQVADLRGTSLGKPVTHDRAVAQLLQLSGQSVVFQTALAVVCVESGFSQTSLAQVRVRFRALTHEEIEAYLHTEPAYDCAGSAKSEGLGIALLDAIDSDDPSALVGLPLIRTCQLLRQAGLKIPA